MSTARDIIEGSLRIIGALASGESASAEQGADGLITLNEMVESWSTEELFIPAIKEESFTLVGGTGQYSMGDGATFDTDRPLRFESVVVVDGSNDIPMTILNSEQWADIKLKSTNSTIPMYVYPEGTFPNETLNFWPVPSAAKTVKFWTQKILASFTNLSTSVSLPPGYKRALRYNLAIDLCPEYGKEVTVTIDKIAREAKANVKRKNIRPYYLKSDLATLQRDHRNRYNILLGE